MYQGIITYDSGKGWFFVERDGDSVSVFVHSNQVENHRQLHLDDRIEFDVAPGHKPGKLQAVKVRYLGHVVARQVSGTGGAF